MSSSLSSTMLWALAIIAGGFIGVYLSLLRERFESGPGLRTIRLCLETLAVGVGAFLLFRGPRFTDGQAKDLALIVAAIYGAISAVNEKVRRLERFTPFHIGITPKWYQLLLDHGVVDEESWKRVQSEVEKAENTLSFTVLSPKLFYSGQGHQPFFTNFSLRVDLDRIWPDDMKRAISPEPRLGSRGPAFTVRAGLDRTKTSLWDNPVWAFDLIWPHPVDEKENYDYSRVNLLARLPKRAFDPYYGIHQPQKAAARLEKELERNGWKQHHGVSGHIILDHKYLTVLYWDIADKW